MSNSKQVIQQVAAALGKTQVINAMQWLGSFGIVKQATAYDDFVLYASEYIKNLPSNKKPSGFTIKSYDDQVELVTKYVKFFAAEDIETYSSRLPSKTY